MKVVYKDPKYEFQVRLLDKGEMADIRDRKVKAEMKPVVCFVKPDGAIGIDANRSCLIFIVSSGVPGLPEIVTQISARMMVPVIQELAKIAVGLEYGKGMSVVTTFDDLVTTLKALLIDNVWGAAGHKVTIERAEERSRTRKEGGV